MVTVQTGNVADGDIIGGNKTVNQTVNNHQGQQKKTSVARLYEILSAANEGQPFAAQIADELQHWSSKASSDVRGLEEKLTAADRQDLIDEASFWKEKAAKLIMRWQTSGAAQDIITHVLSHLWTSYVQNVKPAIEANATRADVDALIHSKVLNPTFEMLEGNDLGLTQTDLLGLYYFLGGNCHLRWDAC